jgi:hypothetical protein
MDEIGASAEDDSSMNTRLVVHISDACGGGKLESHGNNESVVGTEVRLREGSLLSHGSEIVMRSSGRGGEGGGEVGGEYVSLLCCMKKKRNRRVIASLPSNIINCLWLRQRASCARLPSPPVYGRGCD